MRTKTHRSFGPRTAIILLSYPCCVPTDLYRHSYHNTAVDGLCGRSTCLYLCMLFLFVYAQLIALHLSQAGLSHQEKMAALALEDNARQCLTYQMDPRNVRPETPAEIKHYRRSFQREPGQRFIHTGLVDVPLPPEHFRHGTQTSAGDRFADCLEQAPPTELQDFLNEQKESIYQSRIREPLGSGYRRGHVLPAHTQDPKFRFGHTSSVSESAKGLIYFNEPIPNKQARSLAAKMTTTKNTPYEMDRDITRQIDRNYDWNGCGIDPNTHRFGKTEPLFHNGVAQSLRWNGDTKIASNRVVQVRSAMHDRLGKGREVRGALRNLGEDFAFGKTNEPDEWGAKKCIQGNYSLQDQMPDKDLGMSTRKLARIQQIPPNIGDRAYGIPSIRMDLRAPHMRSVADPQNYGNEADCKGLLYPSRFASDGVTNSASLCLCICPFFLLSLFFFNVLSASISSRSQAFPFVPINR